MKKIGMNITINEPVRNINASNLKDEGIKRSFSVTLTPKDKAIFLTPSL